MTERSSLAIPLKNCLEHVRKRARRQRRSEYRMLRTQLEVVDDVEDDMHRPLG